MLCFNPFYLKFYCLGECLKYKRLEYCSRYNNYGNEGDSW